MARTEPACSTCGAPLPVGGPWQKWPDGERTCSKCKPVRPVSVIEIGEDVLNQE